jgi:hypothetical protein
MNQNSAHPSPFYAQFDDATEFTLCFPTDEDGAGPYWLESGELDASQGRSRSCEKVEAVDLGDGRYRLAFKGEGPFSGLRLNWGDEFVAEAAGVKKLQFQRVSTPRAYKHFRLMVSAGFNNENPLAKLVHRFGGGWECVAGGMLTLTVPTTMTADFEAAAQLENLCEADDLEQQ